MSHIACHRYTRRVYEAGASLIEEERMVGTRSLREAPSSDGASRWTLVVFARTICDGKQTSWSEHWASDKPFYAADCYSLPMTAQNQLKSIIDALLGEGFSLKDQVQVDAEGCTVIEPVETLADESGSVFNWMLKSPADQAQREKLKALLAEAFEFGSDTLGYSMSYANIHHSPLPTTLMRIQGKVNIEVNTSLGDNCIDPVSLEGAGEFRPCRGHKPLLMLFLLQKQYLANSGAELLFCTQDGESFNYDGFDSLKALISQFGFEEEEVRSDAEKLGLIMARIAFNQIETDTEDFFF